MGKENKPLNEKEQTENITDGSDSYYFHRDVKQAVKEAYEELRFLFPNTKGVHCFTGEQFRWALKETFKDKFGFELK